MGHRAQATLSLRLGVATQQTASKPRLMPHAEQPDSAGPATETPDAESAAWLVGIGGELNGPYLPESDGPLTKGSHHGLAGLGVDQ